MIGPLTGLILGCILLAILVSVLVYVGKQTGMLDPNLAQKIMWGTGMVILVVIGVALIVWILQAFGGGGGIRLP